MGEIIPWSRLAFYQKLARAGIAVICLGALASIFNIGFAAIGIGLGGIMFAVAALLTPGDSNG